MSERELREIETRALRTGQTYEHGDVLKLTAEIRRLREQLEDPRT